jgi:hypothetical protein
MCSLSLPQQCCCRDLFMLASVVLMLERLLLEMCPLNSTYRYLSCPVQWDWPRGHSPISRNMHGSSGA